MSPVSHEWASCPLPVCGESVGVAGDDVGGAAVAEGGDADHGEGGSGGGGGGCPVGSVGSCGCVARCGGCVVG